MSNTQLFKVIDSDIGLFIEDGKAVLAAKTIKHEAGGTGAQDSSLENVEGLTVGSFGTLSSNYFTNFPGLNYSIGANASNGYAAGGFDIDTPTSPPYTHKRIEKFPFASDTNATNIGDLTQEKSSPQAASSDTHAYCHGLTYPPTTGNLEKYSFAQDGNAIAVTPSTGLFLRNGQTNFYYYNGAQGNHNTEKGFVAGGPTTYNADTIPGQKIIVSWPFANEAFSAHGNLAKMRVDTGDVGSSSSSHGYIAGGGTASDLNPPSPYTYAFTEIAKFSFVNDANYTTVGDLTAARTETTSASSSTNGYTMGGRPQYPPYTIFINNIDRFPFATDTNAVDYGNLVTSTPSNPSNPGIVAGRHSMGGSSSATHGYVIGGYKELGAVSVIDQIQKFQFTSSGSATDVGNLATKSARQGGAQG